MEKLLLKTVEHLKPLKKTIETILSILLILCAGVPIILDLPIMIIGIILLSRRFKYGVCGYGRPLLTIGVIPLIILNIMHVYAQWDYARWNEYPPFFVFLYILKAVLLGALCIVFAMRRENDTLSRKRKPNLLLCTAGSILMLMGTGILVLSQLLWIYVDAGPIAIDLYIVYLIIFYLGIMLFHIHKPTKLQGLWKYFIGWILAMALAAGFWYILYQKAPEYFLPHQAVSVKSLEDEVRTAIGDGEINVSTMSRVFHGEKYALEGVDNEHYYLTHFSDGAYDEEGKTLSVVVMDRKSGETKETTYSVPTGYSCYITYPANGTFYLVLISMEDEAKKRIKDQKIVEIFSEEVLYTIPYEAETMYCNGYLVFSGQNKENTKYFLKALDLSEGTVLNVASRDVVPEQEYATDVGLVISDHTPGYLNYITDYRSSGFCFADAQCFEGESPSDSVHHSIIYYYSFETQTASKLIEVPYEIEFIFGGPTGFLTGGRSYFLKEGKWEEKLLNSYLTPEGEYPIIQYVGWMDEHTIWGAVSDNFIGIDIRDGSGWSRTYYQGEYKYDETYGINPYINPQNYDFHSRVYSLIPCENGVVLAFAINDDFMIFEIRN